jgi:hypothetical protein
MELGSMVEIESVDNPGVLQAAHLREQELHTLIPGVRIFSVSLDDAADTYPAITDAASSNDQIFRLGQAGHNVVNEVQLFNNALYPNSLVYFSNWVNIFDLKAASASEADPRAVK